MEISESECREKVKGRSSMAVKESWEGMERSQSFKLTHKTPWCYQQPQESHFQRVFCSNLHLSH